ncbi:putative LRR receptor-like serine/threonine-protein kinase [Capsicum baccatum]|uniref:LRR receptor-like serine/threonine-protein kinase n=1 Tax=Capsicum baccatum TaxID=33114 RepID=A0A2G2XDM2_CAPBA|nr:putative LRR receptor-like serine/threonine-protein kinase [Capsicum baccatum]
MLANGFKINECDKCVYIKDTPNHQVIVCSYVDDMLIIDRDISDINATKRLLESKFDMKDLGVMDVILGIKIHKGWHCHSLITLKGIERLEITYVRAKSKPLQGECADSGILACTGRKFEGVGEFGNEAGEVLDLSFNQMDGPLLTSLLTLPTIEELLLQNNALVGNIDFPAPSATPNLHVLDLSHNQLDGSFPDGFGSLTALQVFDIAGNDFCGPLPMSIGQVSSLTSLDISQNHFTGPLPKNLPDGLQSFDASLNDLSGSGQASHKTRKAGRLKPSSRRASSRRPHPHVTENDVHRQAPSYPSGFSNRKGTDESGESYAAENFARLDVRYPDRLDGELYFLDDTISFTPAELSRAPAEVLGRNRHGTSYRATLENGLLLTVKWLREGVAKQRKDFAKEAKTFANIMHPNVVGFRGYYWGPPQPEKLILSDYVSPGSLASFLYDRPDKKGPPLAWSQRLKISVDVERGLNHLHFDREVPHGNLKATNILLDGPDLNARVADYCLHRLMTQAGKIEQILDAGVLGYRAPELAASKKPLPSFKSDVYAFGVILLVLLLSMPICIGADSGILASTGEQI